MKTKEKQEFGDIITVAEIPKLKKRRPRKSNLPMGHDLDCANRPYTQTKTETQLWGGGELEKKKTATLGK